MSKETKKESTYCSQSSLKTTKNTRKKRDWQQPRVEVISSKKIALDGPPGEDGSAKS